MLKPLYSLEKIDGKEVYVWDTNRTSAIVFTQLIFCLIDVKGFIVKKTDKKEIFFNRPIIMFSSIIEPKNIVLITTKKTLLLCKQEVPEGVELLPLEELFSNHFNKELLKRNIYLYGAGNNSSKISEKLKLDGIKVCGKCVTRDVSDNGDSFVKKYVSEDYSSEDAMIIAVENYKYREEILDLLTEFPGDVYIDQIIMAGDAFLPGEFSLILDRAQKKGDRIFLCGGFDLYTELIEEILKLYSMTIYQKISLESELKFNIGDINDLLYEDINHVTVIVNSIDSVKLNRIMNRLYEIGLKLDDRNICGIQWYTASEENMCHYLTNIPDTLLWYSTSYNHGQEKGWRVLGSDKIDDVKKIMILGGSTSTDGIYRMESWGRKLYRKLTERGDRVQVWIGAHCGEDVVSELLRLLRDGTVIKPDLVISMSGVNNIRDWDINRFNIWDKYLSLDRSKNSLGYFSGLKTEESAFDFWVRIECLMQEYVRSIGGKMFSILQPINIYQTNMDLNNRMRFEVEGYTPIAKEFYEKASNEKRIINWIGLFHDNDAMYIDYAHYTDRANEIIAEKMLEII